MLIPISSATSRPVKRRFPRNTALTLLIWSSPVDADCRSDLWSSPADVFKNLKTFTALSSVHTVFVCLAQQVPCLCKIFNKFTAQFLSPPLPPLSHTPHTHTLFFIVTLSLLRQTACVRANFSECSSRTNGHSEKGQMAFCCQDLLLCGLSSRTAPSE